MPRLERFEIEIETGDKGTEGPIQFRFNGHTLNFEEPTGGTAAQATFPGPFEPRSFAHSLVLLGPESGEWALERVRVQFYCSGTDPYSVCYGAAELNERNALDLWQDPPLESFEV